LQDGYTDLAGMFDYVSVSSDLGSVQQLALLVVHDQHGCVARLCSVPKF
jgi:hypothetical protein